MIWNMVKNFKIRIIIHSLPVECFTVKRYEESYRAGMSYLLFHVDDFDMPEALKTIEAEAKGSVTANFFKARRVGVFRCVLTC